MDPTRTVGATELTDGWSETNIPLNNFVVRGIIRININLQNIKGTYHILKMEVKKIYINKQGKSEGFDSCNRPSNLTQIGFKLSIFQPM